MILNILRMEYSKEVKKLLKAIKDKQEQIRQSEKKKTNLEEDVTKREKWIEQKIKILKRHLEEQENSGKKLQENINELENKQKILENNETTLDKVWYIYINLMSLRKCELQKWDVIIFSKMFLQELALKLGKL